MFACIYTRLCMKDFPPNYFEIEEILHSMSFQHVPFILAQVYFF